MSLSFQQNWFHVNRSSGAFSIFKKKKRFFRVPNFGIWPGTPSAATGKVGSQPGTPGAATGLTEDVEPGGSGRQPGTPGAATGKSGTWPGTTGSATG